VFAVASAPPKLGPSARALGNRCFRELGSRFGMPRTCAYKRPSMLLQRYCRWWSRLLQRRGQHGALGRYWRGPDIL